MYIAASGNKNGYVQRTYTQQVKRYCQVLDLIDDPSLVAAYVEAHDLNNHWKEILEGIRAVGILEMEIYLNGSRLVMIVETGLDFEWETAFSQLATMPRQAEWEEKMSFFQLSEGQTSADKWQLMDRVFHLYDSSE